MLWTIGGFILRLARAVMRIILGQSTRIRSTMASLRASYAPTTRIGYGTAVTSDVSIGDYSYVNRDSSIEKCHIGNYCSISSGVRINPWEHDIKSISTSPQLGGSQIDLRDEVILDNDVLISANAIILSGCHLGTGCVVGAGAVVTKDVQPYEVVGGVPAKHIKYRFDQKTIDFLLGTEYWLKSPDEASMILQSIVLPD